MGTIMAILAVMAILAIRDSFQFRRDRVFACRHVPGDTQDVGFAADLAVFDIALRTAGGLVHRGFVPLTTAGALESWGHPRILGSLPP